jgi:hypothetical protein
MVRKILLLAAQFRTLRTRSSDFAHNVANRARNLRVGCVVCEIVPLTSNFASLKRYFPPKQSNFARNIPGAGIQKGFLCSTSLNCAETRLIAALSQVFEAKNRNFSPSSSRVFVIAAQ